MSLLTVTEALGYENLGGGSYKQSTNRITNVPGSAGGNGVRQPLGLPNGAVPGVQNPIPTSTARPGKQTNQRITYARVQTAFDKGPSNISRMPVMEGDVVFVFRHDGTNTPGVVSGRDVGRTSRVASVAQLNAMFASGNSNTTGELTMSGDRNPRGLTRDEWLQTEWDGDAALGEAVYDSNPEWHRWKFAQTLARWAPDGVLASKEHDVVMDVSNPGEAYNVAIGGPTLARNSAHGEFVQHIDDGMRVLDKVFCGLIATEHRAYDANNNTYGKVDYYSYEYKLFTSRQLVWAPLGEESVRVKDIERNAAGGVNTLGPTVAEFARMVQVWKFGTVMDTKAGMSPYKCAMLNVVVEPWNLSMIQLEYNLYFGESFALAPADADAVLELLQKSNETVSKEGTDFRTALATLKPLYSTSFAIEVAQWAATDAEWLDDVKIAVLRNVPPPDAPSVSASQSHHGHVIGAQRAYAPGSNGIKEFRATFVKNDEFNGEWCARCRSVFRDYPYLIARIGRAAALAADDKVLSWLKTQTLINGKPPTTIVQEAVEMHAIVTGLRPMLRLGEAIEKGLAQPAGLGGKWPVDSV